MPCIVPQMPHIWSRSFSASFRGLGKAGLASLLLALCGCSRPAPNVLLVTLDTTRADHIGCYGFPLAQTPRLDRLAREGVRCANAVTAAPITLPSHSTLLTRLYPPAHGVRDHGPSPLGGAPRPLPPRPKPRGDRPPALPPA